MDKVTAEVAAQTTAPTAAQGTAEVAAQTTAPTAVQATPEAPEVGADVATLTNPIVNVYVSAYSHYPTCREAER